MTESKPKNCIELWDNPLIGTVLWQDGEILYMSASYKKITGYSLQDYRKMNSVFDIVHPDDYEKVMQNIRNKLELGIESSEYEVKIITKEGRITPIKIYSKLVQSNGKPAILGTLAPITDFDTQYDNPLVATLIYRQESDLKNFTLCHINKLFTDMTGYTKEELIKMDSFFNIIYPDDLEFVKAKSREKLDYISETTEYQTRIITRLGNIKTIRVYSSLIRREGKEYIWATFNEIKDPLDEIVNLFERQPDLGLVLLQDHEVKYVNPYITNILGYSKDGILNMKAMGYLDYFHPDDQAFVLEQTSKKQQGISEGTVSYSNLRIRHQTGNYIAIESFSRIIEIHGKPASFIVVRKIDRIDPVLSGKSKETSIIEIKSVEPMVLKQIETILRTLNLNYDMWKNKEY